MAAQEAAGDLLRAAGGAACAAGRPARPVAHAPTAKQACGPCPHLAAPTYQRQPACTPTATAVLPASTHQTPTTHQTASTPPNSQHPPRPQHQPTTPAPTRQLPPGVEERGGAVGGAAARVGGAEDAVLRRYVGGTMEVQLQYSVWSAGRGGGAAARRVQPAKAAQAQGSTQTANE